MASDNAPSPSHGRRPDSSPFLAQLGGADPGRAGPHAHQATVGMEEATAAATGLLTPSRSPPSPSSRCRGEERLWWGWGSATATLGQDSARRGQGDARLGHGGAARRCRAARREGATVAWGSGGGGLQRRIRGGLRLRCLRIRRRPSPARRIRPQHLLIRRRRALQRRIRSVASSTAADPGHCGGAVDRRRRWDPGPTWAQM